MPLGKIGIENATFLLRSSVAVAAPQSRSIRPSSSAAKRSSLSTLTYSTGIRGRPNSAPTASATRWQSTTEYPATLPDSSYENGRASVRYPSFTLPASRMRSMVPPSGAAVPGMKSTNAA